ncbi:MAG TPA: hypothetical protein VKS81_09195, partial [Bacteroidota bacterium]|nr:hypothetical protein [Bacteroidota bacterium]
MKKYLAIILCFVCSAALAQESISVCTISPDKPKAGDKIVITYNSSPMKATFKNVPSIKAQLLIGRDGDSPLLVELPMTKDGYSWTSTTTLAEKKANILFVQFKAGDKTDDNSGDAWSAMVYGTDGKVMQGAHVSLASALLNGNYYGFAKTKDAEAGKQEALKEKELFPGNFEPYKILWNLATKAGNNASVKAELRKELDEVMPRFRSEKSGVYTFVLWYKYVGDTVTANKLHDDELMVNPKGAYAESEGLRAMMDESDPDKRIAMLEKYNKDFPDSKPMYIEPIKAGIARGYISKKEYDKAADYLDKNIFPAPNTCNSLSKAYLGLDGQVDKAIYWAKKAISFTDNLDMAKKPSYESDDDYRDNNNGTRSAMLDTYYKCLVKKGDYPTAEKSMEDAYALTKGEDVDINTDYVDALVKAEKYDKAGQVASDCIKKGNSADDLIAA